MIDEDKKIEGLRARVVKLKTVLLLDIRARLEEKILNILVEHQTVNVECYVKITIDEDNVFHILAFINPFTRYTIGFFLTFLARFVDENKMITKHYPIRFDVKSLTEDNLSLETIVYPWCSSIRDRA